MLSSLCVSVESIRLLYGARTATTRNAFRCKSEVDILLIHESIFATLDWHSLFHSLKPSMAATSPRGNDLSLQGQPLVLISTANKVKPFPIHICTEKYMIWPYLEA